MTTEDQTRADETQQQTPKFVIVGDWLCVETGGCTCGANHAETGPEPYCGLEPAASLADVHTWIGRGVEATVSGFDGTPGRDYQLIEFRVPVGTLNGVRLGTRWWLTPVAAAVDLDAAVGGHQ
jgi:hypothetical protein